MRDLLLSLLAAAVVALPPRPLRAQEQPLSNIPGVFSEVGFGVRPAGMGQAFTAVANDANAFLTNPAGMLQGRRSAFTANYVELFGIVPAGYFGLLQPMNDRYALGAGFQFVGDDALMENTAGISISFSPPNLPIGGNEIYFDQMAFGITIKGRWASFGNNADGGDGRVTGSGSGYSIDFGYMFLVNKNLTLGLMVRDVLNSFSWNSSVSGKYDERVPTRLRFGAAFKVDELTLAFDLRKNLYDDTANRAYFGAERSFFGSLMLRMGFSNNLGTSDLNRRWSFGASLAQGLFENYLVRFNTAYGWENIDSKFRFGLDIDWGRPKRKPPKGRMY